VRQSYLQTIHFKQTIIPILLTLGLLLPGIVALGFISNSESPFAAFRNSWFVAVSATVGLVFLTMAFLNMLQVRQFLIRNSARNPPNNATDSNLRS
jgi:hypothetical protein